MRFKLTPQTVLRRASGLVLHVESNGDVRAWLGDLSVRAGRHSLAVLDAFAAPTSFGEALRLLGLRVAGADESVELTNTIFRFCEAGILDPDGGGPPQSVAALTRSTTSAHVLMLNDHARTTAFLDAIRAVVRPGDVVLDLGTGSGVLAVGAARAGARHVYAIEARAIGRVAREVFAANGLSDRITLLEGWSSQITLPERADVLVSEIIGDELLSERAIESIHDARQRLLKPDARVIPLAARLVALPVAVPRDLRSREVPTDYALRDWRARYGIDFSPLADAARRTPQSTFVNPHECRGWEAVCAPIVLAEVDFSVVDRLVYEGSVTALALSSGTVDGILVYSEIDVAPGIQHSLDPRRATPENSWKNPLWLLSDRLVVAKGDELEVTYRYGGPDPIVSARVSVKTADRERV